MKTFVEGGGHVSTVEYFDYLDLVVLEPENQTQNINIIKRIKDHLCLWELESSRPIITNNFRVIWSIRKNIKASNNLILL